MMVDTVILVISCQAHRETRQQAIRETWARRLQPGQRVLFVEGGHEIDRIGGGGDRLLLSVPDSYDDLAEKTYRALQLSFGALPFRGLVKCDDDTYLDCARLARAAESLADYVGNPPPDQPQFAPYAQGGCYWLSRHAVETLVARPFEACSGEPWFKGNSRMRKLGESSVRAETSIEDVMVGSLLRQGGIPLTVDRRFHSSLRPPLPATSNLIANHYVRPFWMFRLDRMSNWPSNALSRLAMRAWAWLPSASPPR